MFKSAKPNRLITVIIWIVIILFAIVKLPSTTRLITNLNAGLQPASQIAGSRQLNRAERIQNHWGRRLNHTQTVDLVYNRDNGQLTRGQQSRIDQRVNQLNRHRNRLNIQRVTDRRTDPDGLNQIKAPDRSTEIVKLQVNARTPRNRTWVRHVQSVTKVPTLRSAVTSPEILNAAGIRSTVHMTSVIIIVGLLLSSLAIGLLFKSLIAPVISLITLLATYLVTISAAGNLAPWLGFNEYTPLAILLAVLVPGTVINYFVIQAVARELPRHRDANNAVQAGLRYVRRPLLLSGVVLTAAFGITTSIPDPVIRPVANFGIAFAVLTLAGLTIEPAFMAWLGSTVLWPSRQYRKPNDHRLWNRLTRLSLWQPLIGIIAVVYFVVPFAYSYRPNFNYDQVNNLTSRDQADRGSNWLNAHFTEGKATPVTIDLKSGRQFNHEATLRTVDELTTKLQTMSGVNAVYSVTQPSGMPINKYYVNHQLATVRCCLPVSRRNSC